MTSTETSRRQDGQRQRVAALGIYGRDVLAELDRVSAELGAVVLAQLGAD